MKIKTIISGLGNIGMLYDYNSNKVITHSKNIYLNNNFILCGGVDKKKINRKKFELKYKKPSFNDLFTALKITNPNLVILAYEEKKLSYLKKILDFSSVKNLIIEKPFLHKYAQLKNFIKFLKKKKKNFYINFNREYNSEYNKLKKTLIKNKFGKIKYINFYTSGNLISNFSHFLYFILDQIVIGKYKIIKNKNFYNICAKNLNFNLFKTKDLKYFFFKVFIFYEKGIVSIYGPPEKILVYSLSKKELYKSVTNCNLIKSYNLGILKNNLYNEIYSNKKNKFKIKFNKIITYTKIMNNLKKFNK